jgi:hypothetical protein
MGKKQFKLNIGVSGKPQQSVGDMTTRPRARQKSPNRMDIGRYLHGSLFDKQLAQCLDAMRL